ncbi:TPA: hypothetical protein DEP96_01075 [Candidatus Uhrbacteria bacterium]|nr:hypothetical protein [Candidatus Uhrbacteria bacterium]
MLYAAFLIILFTSFAILTWRNFRFALTLFCGLFPLYLLRFSLGPLPTTALEVLILILLTIWLVQKHFLHNQHLVLPNSKGWRLALIFLLACAFFAAAHAPNVFAALGILKAYYLEPAFILLLTLSTFKKPTDWASAFTALVASAVIVALLGLFQYISGLGFPLAWLAEHRVTSVFDFPNAVGLFLAPILAMLIVALVNPPPVMGELGGGLKVKRKLALIGSAAAILLAIILAKTEAAIVAIPIALLITLLLSKAKPTIKGVSLFVFSLALIGALAIPQIRTKIFLNDVSGTARTQMWHETLSMLRDQPLQGAGLSGFPSVITPYHDGSYFEIFQYPHNIFLNIWVELGLPGLLAFFIISYLILKTLYSHRTNPMSLALLAAFFTILIHGLVDVPFFKNDLAMLTAFLLAATIYLNNQPKQA